MNFFKWLFGIFNRRTHPLKPSIGSVRANQSQEVINESQDINFFIESFKIEESTQVGMPVNLWIPKDNNPNKVYIYPRSGPGGYLGTVPSKYFSIIASHLVDGLDYKAEIEDLTDNSCKIKCRLISKVEAENRKEEGKESLRKELTQAYNPKRPITLTLPRAKNNAVKAGDKLVVKFDDLDSYLEDVSTKRGPYSCQWSIKFFDQTGESVGVLENNKSTIQKILKAHFNSYNFDIEVSDTFHHLDYSAEKERSGWKGYPTKIIITPYKKT